MAATNLRRNLGDWCVLAALLGVALLTVGCHHNKQRTYQPPPPDVYTPTHRPITPLHSGTPSGTTRNTTPSAPPETRADIAPSTPPPGFYDDISGPPISVETGLASWYGPNYHHHAAADGTTFDQNAMTAAHRTLPLGTTVRVTNIATGQQVLVRITDRGPFAPDRILDLSKGAADAISGVRAGIIKVKVEAWTHPSADPSGRWAVQTGAFHTEQEALDLKGALLDRYKTARVSEFAGPTGYWVRIDPANHAKNDAVSMQDWIGQPFPYALPYLVRID
jgi:rare lipoprotein A